MQFFHERNLPKRKFDWKWLARDEINLDRGIDIPLLTGPSKKFDSIQNAFGAAASECRRIRRGFMAKFQEIKSKRMSENVIENATTCSQKCRTRVFLFKKEILSILNFWVAKTFQYRFL